MWISCSTSHTESSNVQIRAKVIHYDRVKPYVPHENDASWLDEVNAPVPVQPPTKWLTTPLALIVNIHRWMDINKFNDSAQKGQSTGIPNPIENDLRETPPYGASPNVTLTAPEAVEVHSDLATDPTPSAPTVTHDDQMQNVGPQTPVERGHMTFDTQPAGTEAVNHSSMSQSDNQDWRLNERDQTPVNPTITNEAWPPQQPLRCPTVS